MSRRNKLFTRLRGSAAVAALIVFVGVPLEAQAGIWLEVWDGTHRHIVSDRATPGRVEFSTTRRHRFGNFMRVVDVGFGSPRVGSPARGVLGLRSLDLTTGARGGVMRVLLTETGFHSLASAERFVSTIRGTYVRSSARLVTYLDTGDKRFGKGTLLTKGLLDNKRSLTTVPVSGPFSLTEIITLRAGAHSLTRIGAALRDPPLRDPPIADVPEPASLSLLGVGLLALGAIGWRRRRVGARAACAA